MRGKLSKREVEETPTNNGLPLSVAEEPSGVDSAPEKRVHVNRGMMAEDLADKDVAAEQILNGNKKKEEKSERRDKRDEPPRDENNVSIDVSIKKVTLKVEYAMNGFKEIRNSKAFGLLSLWSQIGGFIGIFLGYSLLQVPELIREILNWAKYITQTN